MAYTVCPKCHFQEPSTTACSRCGTVFAQWYSVHVPHPAPEENPPAAKKKDALLELALRQMQQQRAKTRLQRRRRRLIVLLVILGTIVVGMFALLELILAYGRLFANA